MTGEEREKLHDQLLMDWLLAHWKAGSLPKENREFSRAVHRELGKLIPRSDVYDALTRLLIRDDYAFPDVTTFGYHMVALRAIVQHRASQKAP